MKRLAQFIVEKRLIFFLIFLGVIAYCIFGITKIEVEYEITAYLPEGTDTKKAIKIMDEEFAAFGSATFMVKGIDGEAAAELAEKLKNVEGVTNVGFDGTTSSYKDGNALFTVYYAGGSSDPASVDAYNQTLNVLSDSGYNYCVPTPLVNNYADKLAHEVVIVLGIAAVVIIAVLFFTSKSYAEVLAFPAVFIVAAVLNMGTNYWLGKISFVSNTVCIVLQLALAIDYAIILCHRFTEEKDKNPGSPKAALTAALGKAIPEIASSSLTTVSGLVALMFMQLGLGFDLGMVLAKSIICSLITVFLFMPSILMWLSRPMDRTRHRNFVPKITLLGVGVIKIRYALVAVFAALFGTCAYFSQTIDFCYSQNSIDTSRPSETMIAQREEEAVFGTSNMFVVLLPKDTSPEDQREVVAIVQSDPVVNVTTALGWAAISLPSRSDPNKQYYLTDEITYKDLSDMTGLSELVTLMLFMGYVNDKQISASPYEYAVTAADLFEFVFSDERFAGMIGGDLAAYTDVLAFGREQLVGTNHYRLVFGIDAPAEGEVTFAFIERITAAVKEKAPSAIFAGASMSAYDLNSSFKTDNLLITLLTIAFIFIILAVTFRSWGIPIMLVAVIQGAIFINFTLPVMVGNNMFFFVYLIASAIQMGATIDYAILMTNRFLHSPTQSRKESVIGAMTEAFPTIITSGTIMSVASFLVGFITSDPLISSMGMILGLGTVISVVCVLFVLPALLYILGPALNKTIIKPRLRASKIFMPNPSLRPCDAEKTQRKTNK